jgi:hypothetical protein
MRPEVSRRAFADLYLAFRARIQPGPGPGPPVADGSPVANGGGGGDGGGSEGGRIEVACVYCLCDPALHVPF